MSYSAIKERRGRDYDLSDVASLAALISREA